MGWLLFLVLYLSKASVRARLVSWVLRPREPFALQVVIQALACALAGWGLFMCAAFAYGYLSLLFEVFFG